MISTRLFDKGRSGGTGMGRGRGRGGGGGIDQGMGRKRGRGRGLGKGRRDISLADFSPPASEPLDTALQTRMFKAQSQDMMVKLSTIIQRTAETEASSINTSAPKRQTRTASDEKNRFMKMMAVINQERCMNCGLCIEACLEQAISMNDILEIDSSKCTGCGFCINECPNEAISLSESTTC